MRLAGRAELGSRPPISGQTSTPRRCESITQLPIRREALYYINLRTILFPSAAESLLESRRLGSHSHFFRPLQHYFPPVPSSTAQNTMPTSYRAGKIIGKGGSGLSTSLLARRALILINDKRPYMRCKDLVGAWL